MAKKNWKITTLDNGLKVILYPTRNFHHIGIGASVIFGTHDETNQNREIAHLIEHTIFDGTELYPTHEEIETYCDKIAGDFSGSIDSELTQFSGIFPDSEFEGAIRLLDQLLFHPLFRSSDIQKEKSIIKQEILLRWDNIPAKIQMKALWHRIKDKKHPYIFTVPDLLEGVKKISRDEMIKTHRLYYQPKNIVVGLFGHFEAEKAEHLIAKIFGKYKSSKEEIERVKFSSKLYSNQVVDVVQEKCEKVYLLIDFPGFKYQKTPKKGLISNMALLLLVNKRDSQIYSSLREKLGVVYEVGGGFQCYKTGGIFDIGTSCTIDHFKIVFNTIVKEIEKMKSGKVNTTLLKRIIESYRKTARITFDYPGKALDWLLAEIYTRGKIYLPEDYVKIEESITREDIVRLANEIFKWEKANIIIFTPEKPEKLKQITEEVLDHYKLRFQE